MKLHTAFSEAAQAQPGKHYSLPFRLISAQDGPRGGSSQSDELLASVACSNNVLRTPTLRYHPKTSTGTMLRLASFTAEFSLLQSDKFIATQVVPPNTIGDNHPNPFSRNEPLAATLTIAQPLPRSPVEYKFTLHNVPGNFSFELKLKEEGDLWVGLGSPANNNTHQVGWILVLGKGHWVAPAEPIH